MKVESAILNKVSTLRNLPTLPHILVKLIAACNEDNIDLAEISRIVESDPSLSAKILRLVNSAYYGLPSKIESIHHTISYLGTSTLKSIAIGSSITQTFQASKAGTFFNLKAFWWHSLRCAVLARLIARKIQYKTPDEAFLAGLLHDIGRLVLWINYPKEYPELLKKYAGRPDLLLAGEIRNGVTHCEIGAWLLHRWNLQSFMVDAVLYHHESVEKIKNALSLVQVVFVANALSDKFYLEGGRGHGIAEAIIGLGSSQVDDLLSMADQEMGEVAHLLDIEIEEPEGPKSVVSEKDSEKQEDLNREVRDISLLMGTLQELMEAHDEEAILSVVYQGLQILFGIKEAFFFIYDPDKNSLMGRTIKENERSAMIKDLVISLKIEGSLLVSALLQGKPLDLFPDNIDSEIVIIDQQIIRFIGEEGVLCLPMLAHGEHVGVIVMGMGRNDFANLSNQFKLLSLFSKQVALSLHAEQMRRAPLTKIQAERAVASSEIARKVVHEVNNPLSIIKNYLKILGLKLAKQNIAQDEIKILNKEIDRIAHLLGALTSFTKSKKMKRGPVDINTVLSDLTKITRESLRKHSGIELHLDLKYSLPTVISEEDSLKQVFVNLIKNAAEAMPEGGNLYIETRHISNRLEGDRLAPGDGESQEYVEIILKDDGPGIPDEIKSSLFDPFVSTKSGNHSGLGLSIVHNTIKSLDGTLTCESEGGNGTCFKIGLPITVNKSF